MSTESPDDTNRRLLAEAQAQRSLLLSNLQAYEDSAWAAAYSAGRNDAWSAAWRAGYDYAMRVAQEAMRLAPSNPPKQEVSSRPAAPPNLAGQKEKPTAAEIVLELIASRPGLRGVEIVAIVQRLEEPLKERTVRTALHRLKAAEKIKSEAERWYVVGNANGHQVEERMT